MTKNTDDPDALVILRTVAGEGEAGVIRAALDEMGIESYQQAEGVLLGVWAASMNNITSITVRRSDLDRARQALTNNEQDSIDIDWDEVDVGEPVDQTAGRIASDGNEQRSFEQVSLGSGILGACGLLIVLTVAYYLGGLFASIAVLPLGIALLWFRWHVRRKRAES